MKNPIFTAACTLLALALLNDPAQAVVTSITTPTSTITQLTSYPTANTLPYSSRDPAISRDGSKVAFISDADLTGQGTNPDNLRNLFVMNSDGSGLRQLTFATIDPTHQRTITYSITTPRLSADGSVVVFASSNNLLNDANGNPLNPPEHVAEPYYSIDASSYVNYKANNQIFIMKTDGTGLKQLTHGSGDSILPAISHAGDVIVFQSSQDLVGENSDRNVEIYAVKADGSRLSQITTGIGARKHDSRDASISGDGSTVAFDSYIDLLPPLNDDLNDEIFVFDLAGFWRDGAATSDHSKYTVQITNVDVNEQYHVLAENSFEPTLSYDGTWVAFAACINPDGEGIGNPNRTILGTNPFLPDVLYIAKRDGSEMRQLTFSDDANAYAGDRTWSNEDDDIQRPQISDDGRRIVFASRSRVDIFNKDKKFEIAMIDLDAPLGPKGRPVVEQLTYNSKTTGPYVLQLTFGNTDGYKPHLSISGNAGKVVFRSDSNLTGGNPDGSIEVFMTEPDYIRGEIFSVNTKVAKDDAGNAAAINVSSDEASGETEDNAIANSIIPTSDEAAVQSGAQAGDKTGGLGAFGLPELLLALLGLAMLVMGRNKQSMS